MNITDPGVDNYTFLSESISRIMTITCVMRDMFDAETLRDRSHDLVNLLHILIEIADQCVGVRGCGGPLEKAHLRAFIEYPARATFARLMNETIRLHNKRIAMGVYK
ncbi:MAG: hypothetical protein LBE06_08995 [Azoarcus sp.]|nr:hypothetical protein [Azoarcus sp.]